MNGEVKRVKFHDVLSSVLESLAKGKHIYIFIRVYSYHRKTARDLERQRERPRGEEDYQNVNS